MKDRIKVLELNEPPKFEIGTVVATPALMEKVDPNYAFTALAQHIVGNWGLCCADDWACNDIALRDGGRLAFSLCAASDEGGAFWIITEHDEIGHHDTVAGRLLEMAKPMTCSICGGSIEVEKVTGWAGGYNAEPINTGHCCADCDAMIVRIPARIYLAAKYQAEKTK